MQPRRYDRRVGRLRLAGRAVRVQAQRRRQSSLRRMQRRILRTGKHKWTGTHFCQLYFQQCCKSNLLTQILAISILCIGCFQNAKWYVSSTM